MMITESYSQSKSVDSSLLCGIHVIFPISSIVVARISNLSVSLGPNFEALQREISYHEMGKHRKSANLVCAEAQHQNYII